MKQCGFTLIELMIVITIVGILAAVSIPAYQDYLIRARVMDGLNQAEVAQLAVAEAVMATNGLPHDQPSTGYQSPAPTINVQSITIHATGKIVIRYTPVAGGGTVLLTPTIQPTGELTWDCQQGTLMAKYRPANCRLAS